MRARVISVSDVSANPDPDALQDVVDDLDRRGITVELRPYVGGMELIFNEAYYPDVVAAVEQSGFTVVER